MTTTVAPNNGPFNCQFTTGFCGWTQSTTDDFNWSRNRGSTLTSGTGPPGDHTGGQSRCLQRKYMYSKTCLIQHLSNQFHCYMYLISLIFIPIQQFCNGFILVFIMIQNFCPSACQVRQASCTCSCEILNFFLLLILSIFASWKIKQEEFLVHIFLCGIFFRWLLHIH